MYRKEAFMTKQRLIADEEKRMQKREALSINILSAVAHGADTDWRDAEIKDAVDLSVKMADALLEKLYPIKEENPKEESPEEYEGFIEI